MLKDFYKQERMAIWEKIWQKQREINELKKRWFDEAALKRIKQLRKEIDRLFEKLNEIPYKYRED